MKSFVFDMNAWNRLTVYKNWINGIIYEQYLEPFNCVQTND